MIDLLQASRAVEKWQDACFPEKAGRGAEQLLSKAGKLCEEAGEVMGAVIKSRHTTERHAAFGRDRIVGEVGDVLITVLALCAHLDVDPEDVLRDRWESVRRRPDVHPLEPRQCECRHARHAHQTASRFPVACRYCDCPSFALPGTALDRGAC